jgi:hypothetical protein
MMYDAAYAQFASPGAFGQQSGPPGSFGLPPLPGLVPIVTLVPQSLLVTLVLQSLQQAQSPTGFSPGGFFGHVPGQLGQSPLGFPIGQSPPWQSPWQTTGGWGGQSLQAGAFGRGILGYQAAPHPSYAG